ncbi:MAG: MATE family efflux transporter [Lachnospiraceae bacterium]|nr:MATE family efflux transporter [Lachnospiraceae bacterium]
MSSTRSAGRNINMTEGPLFKSIILYSIPIILTNILQLLFNAADLAVVGHFCGSDSVAAVGAATPPVHLLINFFFGISMGVSVAVAYAVGHKDDESVFKLTHTAIPAALISGAVMMLIGVLGARLFLTWMGTPEKVLERSIAYMQIYFAGSIFITLFNFGAALLRAEGDSRSPLYYLTFAGVLNVGLNVLFVTAFSMDAPGVALASTISQGVSAALVLIRLMRNEERYRFRPKQMMMDGPSIRKILSIGVPAGAQTSLFSLANVIIQSSINSFGKVVVAGNSAAYSIIAFQYSAMNSVQQTAMNFTSANYGARNVERMKKTGIHCLIFVAIIGISLGILINVFAEPLLSIFITDSAEAVEYGKVRMLYLGLPYFICGFQEILSGIIRGLGESLVPMVICLMGACVYRIVWVFTVFQMPAFHTLGGLYITYPISWVLTLTALIIALKIIWNKKVTGKM